MEPVDARNGTGEPVQFFFLASPEVVCQNCQKCQTTWERKRASKASILLSLWRVFQFHVLCQLQACFERCPRIWYFAGLQILGLRGARTYNLWSSEVLANRPCAGFGATREACERLERPANQLGSDLWACEQPGRPAS